MQDIMSLCDIVAPRGPVPVLECGGKRSAPPLWMAVVAQAMAERPQSGGAALEALCHRSPKWGRCLNNFYAYSVFFRGEKKKPPEPFRPQENAKNTKGLG